MCVDKLFNACQAVRCLDIETIVPELFGFDSQASTLWLRLLRLSPLRISQLEILSKSDLHLEILNESDLVWIAAMIGFGTDNSEQQMWTCDDGLIRWIAPS